MLRDAMQASPLLVRDCLGIDPHLVLDLDPRDLAARDLVSGTALTNSRATTRTVLRGGKLLTVPVGEIGRGDFCWDIQPAATNKALRSESFGISPWGNSGSSISPNSAVAPDGESTADKLVANTTDNADHQVSQDISGLADDTSYVFSVFINPAEVTWAVLSWRLKTASTWKSAYFDLANGAAGSHSADSSGIEYVGNGVYRCWVAQNLGSGITNPRVYIYLAEGDGDSRFIGNNINGLYVWGAQVEIGTVPTAYIPTGVSAVSRANDGLALATPAGVTAALARQFTLRLAGFVPGFSAADAPGNVALFTCGDFAVYWDPAAGAFAATDGVNVAHGPAVALAYGASYDVVARAQGTTLQMLSRLSTAAAYGAGAAGTYAPGLTPGASIQLGASPIAPFQLGRPSMLNQWLDNLE